MYTFSLKSQRTGDRIHFTIKDLLHKISVHRTNDEIFLLDNEDVFNISSFQDNIESVGADNGGNIINSWHKNTFVTTDNTYLFALDLQPLPNTATVTRNGIVLAENRDYSITSDKKILMNYAITPNEVVTVKYKS